MKVLLIDDMRDLENVMPSYSKYKDFTGITARSYDVGIAELKSNSPFDVLFLDHDLASYDEAGREKTGYDIMCFLEANLELLPKEIVLVTSNPVGRQRMQAVIDKLYGEVK